MSERPTPETDAFANRSFFDREDELNKLYEFAENLERQRDEARELVKAYQDYTQLLGDEISDTASVAYVHGWRSNRYEQGKVLREKIKQLEAAK